MEKLSKKSGRAVIWSAIERVATQGVQFIVMLYLARALGPQAFGTIGMLSIVISIGQILSDGGLTVVLTRRNTVPDDVYNSAFTLNLLASTTIYLIIFALSPYIAEFYSHPELTDLLRFLALNIIFNSLSQIHRIKMSIKLDYHIVTVVSLISTFVGAASALLAIQFTKSAWVLAIQQLTTNFVMFLVCLKIINWIPKIEFNSSILKNLWLDGRSILGAAALDAMFTNMYNVAIGKIFNARELGHFTQANTLTLTPSSTLSFIINRVAFSTLSYIKDDNRRFSLVFEKYLTLSMLIISPLIIIFSINSIDIIGLALGKQWNSIGNLLVILSIGYIFYPIHLLNVSAMQIRGTSRLYLKTEISKKLVQLLIFAATATKGVTAICIGIALGSILTIFINTINSAQITGLPQSKQIKIIGKVLSITLIPASICFLIPTYEQTVINIIVKTLVFLLSYILSLWFFFKEISLEALRLIFNRNP